MVGFAQSFGPSVGRLLVPVLAAGGGRDQSGYHGPRSHGAYRMERRHSVQTCGISEQRELVDLGQTLSQYPKANGNPPPPSGPGMKSA